MKEARLIQLFFTAGCICWAISGPMFILYSNTGQVMGNRREEKVASVMGDTQPLWLTPTHKSQVSCNSCNIWSALLLVATSWLILINHPLTGLIHLLDQLCYLPHFCFITDICIYQSIVPQVGFLICKPFPLLLLLDDDFLLCISCWACAIGTW